MSLLTFNYMYNIYHCLIITKNSILLDTVPTNMTCSALNTLPKAPWQLRGSGIFC